MGRAVVRALLDDGCRVALVDIAERGDAGAGRATSAAASLAVACDISRRERRARRRTRASCRRSAPVDILVNNAGILSNNKVEATERRRMAPRAGAPTSTARSSGRRRCVPAMKARRWGRIVNTSSLAAKTGGLTAGTAYSVSKGALGVAHLLARARAGGARRHRQRDRAGLRADADGHRAAERGAAPGAAARRSRSAASASPRSSRTSCASSPRRSRASSPARSSISTVAC